MSSDAPIERSLRPERRPGFRLDGSGDQLLLHRPEGGPGIRCDRPAALIWRLCDGERTVAECVDLLAGAYPEAADRMGRDVARALRSLVDLGAIELR